MASGGNPQFRYTQPPSKVIHVRNLPWECTDEELAELGSPFGKVVNTKCNVGANRNQAFIEFVSISSRFLVPSSSWFRPLCACFCYCKYDTMTKRTKLVD